MEEPQEIAMSGGADTAHCEKLNLEKRSNPSVSVEILELLIMVE